jgi:hypothetical protein
MITKLLLENDFGDTMSDGLAGPMGLLIIVLLAIATALLIRSMNRHLRRIPERFPSQTADVGQGAGPGGSGSGSGGSVASGTAEAEPERVSGDGARVVDGDGADGNR